MKVLTSNDVKRAKTLAWEMEMMQMQSQADKAARDGRYAEFAAQKAALENMKMKPLVEPKGWQELKKGYPFN